jgi:hypothetical protein
VSIATLTTPITEEAFTAAMRAAVEERGAAYTYPAVDDEVARAEGWRDNTGQCQYQNAAGEPACLIGLALSKIDPSLVPEYGSVVGADHYLRGYGAPQAVQLAASAAQSYQDTGETWGLALDAYERTLEERRTA